MKNVSLHARVVLAAVTMTISGCASTGSTFRSGVPDTFLREAPWYAGTAAGMENVGHLAIQYQRGASHSPIFDPGAEAGGAVAALLRDMNDYLDSLRRMTALSRDPLPGTSPDVQFGCELDGAGDCTNGPAAPFGYGKPSMRLAIGRPSAEWTDAAALAMDSSEGTHVLVITLEVGQYWPRQTSWRGSKAVDLGSNHRVDLPWLTSLETPVSVLQLTGAVIGRDGRAVRIGAEGMLARRTNIVLAGFGAQALITDDDVAQLRTRRRDELPGQPLVWEVALRTLVSQLTGSTPAVN